MPPGTADVYAPLITTIVATLNNSKTLARCLQSIIEQSYSKKEIIVIDGGSTDGSTSLLESLDTHIDYWESKLDRGVYHAWNKALEKANGEWFCFLGADDYFWDKNVLSDFVPYLWRACRSDIRIVYGRVAQVSKNGSLKNFLGKPWERIRWQMHHGMPLPHPGLMHHLSLVDEYGLFDESFKVAGDYEYLLRELLKHSALFAENICSVGHQLGGLSQYNNLKAHLEVAKARKKNGLPAYTWGWLLVFIRAVFRHVWRKYIHRI